MLFCIRSMISKNPRFRKSGREEISGTVLGGFFVALFFGITLFLIANNIVISQKRSQLEQKAKELQTQLETLQAQKTNLEQGIGEVKTQEYQEKILREQGLYKKPGEEVITVLPAKDATDGKSSGQKRIWWDPRTWF